MKDQDIMKNVIKIREQTIGEGIPKICVPITGLSEQEIFFQAECIAKLQCEMTEWRMDCFDNPEDLKEVSAILEGLRKRLQKKILLATFRTKAEGGRKEISFEQYAELNKRAAQSGYFDFIDIEAFSFDRKAEGLIREIQKTGCKVVASNHDFKKTPPKEEIIRRLCRMQEMGADIPKIAVMPQGPEDVLALLAATEEMTRLYADRPVITMSMGGMGCISRICGEFFGSDVTFASVENRSAPGQPDESALRIIMEQMHEKENAKNDR